VDVVVVDASVAVKWFIDEPGTAAAKGWLALGTRPMAPDLVVPEVCNVLWQRARAGDVPAGQAATAMSALERYYERLVPTAPLAERALGIALDLGHPAYDCFYLALAERERTRLLTADKRLARRLEGTTLAPLVELLATPP
jgi:predicted nucleic acid-binding protein